MAPALDPRGPGRAALPSQPFSAPRVTAPPEHVLSLLQAGRPCAPLPVPSPPRPAPGAFFLYLPQVPSTPKAPASDLVLFESLVQEGRARLSAPSRELVLKGRLPKRGWMGPVALTAGPPWLDIHSSHLQACTPPRLAPGCPPSRPGSGSRSQRGHARASGLGWPGVLSAQSHEGEGQASWEGRGGAGRGETRWAQEFMAHPQYLHSGSPAEGPPRREQRTKD